MNNKNDPKNKNKRTQIPSANRRHFLAGSAGAIAASMGLANGVKAADVCKATHKDILGPFHRPAAPFGTKFVSDDEPGKRLMLSGTVYGPDCKQPISQALLDFWQADDAGRYDMPKFGQTYTPNQEYRLRRQVLTDEKGRYSIETIVPGRYKIPTEGPGIEASWAGITRPAHIHFLAAAPGYKSLISQLYFEGDPFIEKDPWANGKETGGHPSPNKLKLANVKQDGSVVSSTFDIILER